MPNSFWIFLLITWIVVYTIDWSQFVVRHKALEKPEVTTKEVKFLGGPLDGKSLPVDETQDFYVTPYIPEDESERGEPVGHLGDKLFYQPKFGYYQQVTDDEYFYVRDITEQELERVQATGELPEVE